MEIVSTDRKTSLPYLLPFRTGCYCRLYCTLNKTCEIPGAALGLFWNCGVRIVGNRLQPQIHLWPSQIDPRPFSAPKKSGARFITGAIAEGDGHDGLLDRSLRHILHHRTTSTQHCNTCLGAALCIETKQLLQSLQSSQRSDVSPE